MKHRRNSSKKELKTKIFKLTSILLIANLVVGGFFVNVPKAFADTTLTLQTVAGGTYTDWNGGETDIDETSSFSCEESDSIREDDAGDRESFTMDLTSIPNGRTITSVSVTVRDRGHSSSGGTYKTFARLNGVNTDASANLSATGGSGDPCSPTKTQILDVADTVKSGATTLQIGAVKTSTNGNTVRVGTMTATVTYSAAADTTAPVITRLGSSPVTVAVGGSYTDVGATALDNIDGNITANIVTVNPVNPAVVGTYTVTYNVSDAALNAATQVTRTVNVTDTVAPVVTVVGANPQTIAVGSSYSELGATVSDNYNTGLVAVINSSSVNTSVVGSYIVTYDAVDSSGNSAIQKTRTVNVTDTVAPVITLNGSNPFTHLVNTPYSDDGATASDNYDGDLTSSITTTSNVNSSVVGSYTVTYDVTDSNGNVATQVSRTVNVVDVTAPIINLEGSNPQTIEVGDEYTELGATVTDDYDTELSATIDASSVNTSVVGTYTVTYNAVDSNENVAEQVTRTVNVVDTTAPVITLTGFSTVTVMVDDEYSDEGATASDNYDGDITESIVTVNSVNTEVVGSYTVTYNVTDSNENAAEQVTRTVNVVDETAPVITLTGSTPVTLLVGESYEDAGATAVDNYDGDLTESIFTVNPVNTLVPGSYTVSYNVYDSSENAAEQVTRTVNVMDTNAPLITLLSINPFLLTTGDSYTDPGATAVDNADGDITENIITVNPVNTSSEGTYTVTYNVTDESGNAAAEVTRTVIVTKPVVSGPTGGGGTPEISPPPAPPSAPPTTGGSVLGEKITRLDELISMLTPYTHDVLVKELQEELKKIGLFSLPYFTDFYGPMTTMGVKKYQDSKVVKASMTGEDTSKLDELIATLVPYTHDPKVKDLQAELKKFGFYLLSYFSDYYGPITNASVKDYLSTK